MPEITTVDKLSIVQILQLALDNAIDRVDILDNPIDSVDIVAEIDQFDGQLTSTADRYLRDLDGCEIDKVSSLFTVLLMQLQEAMWGVSNG